VRPGVLPAAAPSACRRTASPTPTAAGASVGSGLPLNSRRYHRAVTCLARIRDVGSGGGRPAFSPRREPSGRSGYRRCHHHAPHTRLAPTSRTTKARELGPVWIIMRSPVIRRQEHPRALCAGLPSSSIWIARREGETALLYDSADIPRRAEEELAGRFAEVGAACLTAEHPCPLLPPLRSDVERPNDFVDAAFHTRLAGEPSRSQRHSRQPLALHGANWAFASRGLGSATPLVVAGFLCLTRCLRNRPQFSGRVQYIHGRGL
jgi:hypothetical protein